MTTDAVVDVDGRAVRLTTLDRVLWPSIGFTKRDLIEYYARVGPTMLPHLAGRPLTLHRFPEGVSGPHFFQTRCPPHPDWLRTQRMWTFRSGKDVDAPVVDDVAGIVWAANLAAIELHPYPSPADALERPTAMVFDLDPGPPAGVLAAAAVALAVRDVLHVAGLAAFAKTSGGKGMHVYVPVSAASDPTYDDTKATARAVAALLARQHPDRVVDRMTRSIRAGKVFVDWSQNDAGKSTVAPYSLRAGRVPGVSTPVTWAEVERAVDRTDAGALWFAPDDVVRRIEEHGDLFAPVLSSEQRLPRSGRVAPDD